MQNRQHTMQSWCYLWLAARAGRWGRVATAYITIERGSPWITPSLLSRCSWDPWTNKVEYPQWILKQNLEQWGHMTPAFHWASAQLTELNIFLASTNNNPQSEFSCSSYIAGTAPSIPVCSSQDNWSTPHTSSTSKQVTFAITLLIIHWSPSFYQ